MRCGRSQCGESKSLCLTGQVVIEASAKGEELKNSRLDVMAVMV